MDLNESWEVTSLSSSELKKISGGLVGVIIAVASVIVAAYGIGLEAAESAGYADGKAACSVN